MNNYLMLNNKKIELMPEQVNEILLKEKRFVK